MAGRKADDARLTTNRFGAEERTCVDLGVGRIRQHSGEIVDKDEGAFVVGIARAIGADVARAEIALRVISRSLVWRHWLKPAPPGPLAAMRRYQNPLIKQRIIAPMRMLLEVE